jgi:hypothetical protein
MADTATTLDALGTDLAFTISFGIARELLDAATEAGISEDELVAVVLGLSVAFAALPRSISVLTLELRERVGFLKAKEDAEKTASGLEAFLKLLVSIARRISVSITVQLLAANVRTKQPLRSVRVVSLLSVVVFFLFLSGTSSIGARKN